MAWQTCGAGYGRVPGSGSNVEDIQCEICTGEDRQFSTGDDRSECADHVLCPAGEGSTYESLANPTQEESTCAACSANTFSSLEGYGPCETHTVDCDSQGKVVLANATNLADEQCGDDRQCTCANGGTAANGTGCPVDGGAKCVACRGGFHLTVDSACAGKL
jgi:hypothetical protein